MDEPRAAEVLRETEADGEKKAGAKTIHECLNSNSL